MAKPGGRERGERKGKAKAACVIQQLLRSNYV